MMMKKLFPGFVLASILFASCVKKSQCGYTPSTVIAPAAEVQNLKDSLFSHGITSAIMDPSGFFYTIDTTGSGTAIGNLCTNVSVAYKGTYFNGAGLDSTDATAPAIFSLGSVIVGWQKGLPLIKKGGQITLYIPPSLAYGPNALTDNSGHVLIPGNSYLIFDIQLLDVQ